MDDEKEHLKFRKKVQWYFNSTENTCIFQMVNLHFYAEQIHTELPSRLNWRLN